MKTKIVITLTALLVLIGISAKVQNDNQDPGTTSIVGDLNNDNKVNAADIVLLINNLKSKTGDQSTTLPDGTFAEEDINKDGYVNETDLSALVNIVMKDDGLKDLEGEELYEIVRSDLDEFISTHEGATIEDILTEIANYPSKVTTKVEDNILYIDIDGYGYLCDPYGLTLNDHIEDNAIDDNYIENLLMEINNALYPDNAKARSLNVMEGNNSYSTSTGGTANDIVLSKKKILVWNPFDNNTFIYVPEGFKVDEYFHNSKLLGLPTFSDYDIVLMDCHGSKKGEVMVPREDYENQLKGFPPSDYMLGEIKSGGKLILTYVLKESILEKLISKDLSHTMVWTSMCHSNIQNSVIKKVLKGHKAIAFAGANNKVADYVVKDRFTKFITAYYKRISAAEAAKKSFKDSENISDKGTNYLTREYEYKDEKEVLVKGVLRGYDYHNVEEELVEGTYSFEYYNQNNMYTPLVTAMAAIKNQPCASVTLPYELATPVMASRATTRATSASNISAGFWYKNKKTNEETEREFDKSITKLHQRYDYEQLVSRLELLGDTTGLESGIYEYRTYLEIDGEKTYSNDTFEFIKGENFCPDDHHPHIVDLGMPSGIKWACCNMGADFPEMYGDRYASGELEPKTEFSQENYLVDMNISGCFSATQYDPAYTHWGKDWRLPTYSEIYELLNACTEESAVQNGVLGVKITGGTGNSIFLPSSTSSDYYLTGDCKSNTVHTLHFFNITSYLTIYEYENTLRFGGYPIRPVYDPGFKEMSVTTLDASDEKVYSATISGKVENTHWRNATEIGFYYNTTGDPKEGNGDYIAINKTGVFSYNLKNLEPATTYYYVAAAKTLGSTHYGDVKSFTTVKRGVPSRSTLFVDLGLSVIWAGWNVDATSPTETGSYFPWGMTREPIYIDYYVYDHRDGDSSTYPYTKDIGENISGTKYDAARENMKSAWRIPTIEEWDELLDRCTIENYTLDDVNGVTVTGPNGNCIFLPLTGLKWFGTVRDNKTIGYYWSATNAHKYNDNYNSYAYRIRFNLGTGSSLNTLYKEDGRKFFGLPIRAVKNR